MGDRKRKTEKKKKREGQENLSFSLIPQMAPVAEVDPDPSQELPVKLSYSNMDAGIYLAS